MTREEHHARAMLLGKSFDLYTNSSRDRSPEGSKYKYTNGLDAETMEPLGKGVLHDRETQGYKGRYVGNTVSKIRLGLADEINN